MEEKKRCKFDIVAFLAVFILIAFIGCMFVAVVFGIKQQKNLLNVAYADSTNGVVEDNLCLFNDLTELSVNFSSTGSSSFVLPWESDTQNIRAGYNRGSSLIDNVFSSTTLQNGTWATFAYRFLNLPIGTYTATYKVSSIQGYVRMNVTGFGNSSFNNYGLCSITFTTSSIANRDLQVQIQSNSSVTIEWVKLELGSSFTGYVPKDYTNYGYNQGFEHGVDSVSGLQNFSYIGNLGNTYQGNLLSNSLLDLDFAFNNVNYSLNNNNVHYDDSGDFSFYYVSGTFDTPQPGVKVVSDLLYGTIQIAMPYYVGSGQFIDIWFEDTITGQVVSTNYHDTLHFKFIPWSTSLDLSNEATSGNLPLNAWYFVVITYFFENPQNIYFLPHYTLRIHDEFQYRYPSSDLFNIYSTQSLTALSSFDEGYQKGIKDGADGAVQGNAQAVSNARAAGYEQGRRDALADSNDYTFVGLLGAVFDAPIKSFQGLLNFDVLGVNMQSFVLALLSLSVIIIIIKIALGGK